MPSTNQDSVPSNIEIKNITLSSGDKERELLAICDGFTVHESIFSPFITGTITITDSTALVNKFPIVGEEDINIRFSTPGGDFDTITADLKINHILDQKIFKNRRGQHLKFGLVAHEFFNSISQRFSKGYKNKSASAIIRDLYGKILHEYEKSNGTTFTKPLDFVNSSEQISYNIPNVTIFKNIEQVKKEATSTEFPYSPFVLFEDSGNNLRFVEIARLVTQPEIHQYRYDERHVKNDGINHDNNQNISRFNYIENVKYTSPLNVSSLVNGGLVKNSMLGIDPLLKKASKFSTDYFSDVGKYAKFSDQKQSAPIFKKGSNYQGLQEDAAFAFKFFPDERDGASSSSSKTMTDKITYLNNLINTRKMEILVDGNSNLKAGQVINIIVPELTGETNKIQKDRFMTGNYLITTVDHVFTKDEGYKTIVEVVKGSFIRNI